MWTWEWKAGDAWCGFLSRTSSKFSRNSSHSQMELPNSNNTGKGSEKGGRPLHDSNNKCDFGLAICICSACTI